MFYQYEELSLRLDNTYLDKFINTELKVCNAGHVHYLLFMFKNKK